jgi:hypothetical protein
MQIEGYNFTMEDAKDMMDVSPIFLAPLPCMESLRTTLLYN